MSAHGIRVLTRSLLAAMLLAVLAPAVSRALARTRVASDWVEMGTSQGRRWLPWSAVAAHAEPAHALDRCGHCSLADEPFAALLPCGQTGLASDGVWGVPVHPAAEGLGADLPRPSARGPPLRLRAPVASDSQGVGIGGSVAGAWRRPVSGSFYDFSCFFLCDGLYQQPVDF